MQIRGEPGKKRATNFMGAEGKALHKPGVCEKAKHAKHKLLTTKSVQQTTGAEGKALKLYGGPREEHCTNFRYRGKVRITPLLDNTKGKH